MRVRKGERVQELTKKVGQIPRRGTVQSVHGSTVEVAWDDGHSSSITGGFLVPVRRDRH